MEQGNPLISTMDITKDTLADMHGVWFARARKYDCDTCEHSFSVLNGRDEEECVGCDALITARAIKGKPPSLE